MATKAKLPAIPKRLASKIRAAQQKVKSKYISIAGAEYNYRNDMQRLQEYEASPTNFAARYYRSTVDSYPVITNISRVKEKIAYHESRQADRISELAELELGLRTLESEVLAEVTIMRPSSGRVPWPNPLPQLKHFREKF